MNAIQIVRDSEQFPQMERIDENVVNFYFDQSERPYGENTQYMAVMVQVDYPLDEEKEDDIDEVKALAAMPSKNELIAQVVAQLLSPVTDSISGLSGGLSGILSGLEAHAN